jgi:putative sigma-54 modulation protein
MKVTYTGKQGVVPPAQQEKLEVRFSKLGKLLDRGGEKEAHVILTTERHLTHAEITIRFHDHPLAGIGSDVDPFTAIMDAADKLEKQVLKLQTKWRDNKRGPKDSWEAEGEGAEPREAEAEVELDGGPGKKVFRVTNPSHRKPMTLEEALMAMEDDRDYLIYRDAETDHLAVLLRRRDGHFALIEA